MALVKQSHLFGIDELWAYPVTDTSSAYTVGTGIRLSGAKQLSMDFEIEEQELTGDESILRIFTKLKKINFSGEYALLNLDALAQFLGGSVVASGEGDNRKQTFSLQEGAIPGYFQLVGIVKDADVEAVAFHIMKCKMTAHAVGAQENQAQAISFSGSGIKTEYEFTRVKGGADNTAGLLTDIVFHEKFTETAAVVSPVAST